MRHTSGPLQLSVLPSPSIPGDDLGGGPVGRREQAPRRRDRLAPPFEQGGRAPVQSGGDQRRRKAAPWAAANADESADLAGLQRDVLERAAVPAVGDAPGLRQPHQLGPAMAVAPLQDRAPGEAPIANAHGREPSRPNSSAQVVKVVEEGALKRRDACAHGALFVGRPQERDAAAAARQHGLEDAKLAAGGGIHDDRQVLPVAGAPGERGVGERPA